MISAILVTSGFAFMISSTLTLICIYIPRVPFSLS